MIIVILGIVATVFGTVVAAATVLQAIKMAKEHTTKGVSLSFYEMRGGQMAISALFGIATGNIVLIVPGVVGVLATLVVVIVAKHVAHAA